MINGLLSVVRISDVLRVSDVQVRRRARQHTISLAAILAGGIGTAKSQFRHEAPKYCPAESVSHKKKRRFRASFSVPQLKDELELCVGAITQRPGGRGVIAASNLIKA